MSSTKSPSQTNGNTQTASSRPPTPNMFCDTEDESDEGTLAGSNSTGSIRPPSPSIRPPPPKPDLTNSLSQHKERSSWMGCCEGKEYVYQDNKSTETTKNEAYSWEFKCGCCNKIVNDKSMRYCKECLKGFHSLYPFEAPDTRWECSLCKRKVKSIEFDFHIGVCKIHM